MTQRDPFDDLADRFGDHLHRAETRHDGETRRRPVRLRRIALAGGGLAVAGTAAALVIGIGGGSSLDVVSQARAALSPEGVIVHMQIAYGKLGQPDDPATNREVREVWTATNPIRWRFDQTVAQWSYDHGGKNGHPTGRYTTDQFAYADGKQTNYTANENTLQVVSGSSIEKYSTVPPAWPGMPEGQDPVQALRTMLASGTLTSTGRATLYGRSVLKLHGRTKANRTVGMPSFPVEYDVDPSTFEPVRMVITATGMGPGDGKVDPVYVVWFRTVERLPDTARNAGLLTVHAPAGAKVRPEKVIDR
ncbi:MAG: hypothetical protein AAGC46_02745 [Solirubrobacteraceae bacterium]|nr:hypothetical protein [Patulibacter sp.]